MLISFNTFNKSCCLLKNYLMNIYNLGVKIMSDTTKRQHYIWRNYLTRWTDNGDRLKGKLYVKRKKLRGSQNLIEFSKLEKIGFEKFYYDVTGFQDKDVSILNQFLSYMQRKELIKFGIDPSLFSKAENQRDFIEKEIMCSYEDIDNKWKFLDKLSKGDFSFYKNSKKQDILDKVYKNMIYSLLYQEDNLSKSDLLNIMEEFFKDNSDEDDLKYEFNRFFCMQYFRSPRIHNNISVNIEELKKKNSELKELDTNFYVNMVAVYFAEQMALNITHNFSTSILLFENKTDTPFITGDTPIINLGGTEMNKITMFHYPISPRMATQLIVVPKFSNLEVINKNIHIPLDQNFVSIVKNCNQKLADNCVNEIYSNDNNCLKKLNIQ